MNQQTIHLYVNMPEFPSSFSTVAQALKSAACGGAETDGLSSDLPADRPATFPAEHSDLPPVVIHIGAGIYREKLVVSRPNVTFQGEGKERGDVVLVYGHGAMELMPEGDKRGTFRTASVRIDSHDFTARHLTFQNDAGSGVAVGQALALYVDGDRNYFEDCAFLGHQDTLFTAPLPQKEMAPGGFKGPGEYKPRVMGRHYYRNCYIEGDVDFIFGSAVAYFENCELFSRMRENQKPVSPGDKVTCGYVTAASTPQGQRFGYVFQGCRLTGDCPPDSVYLGRPWREYARTVFLNCYLGAHIRREGWHDWNKEHGRFFYAEYRSRGAGASPETRADFSRQLTDEEAAEYTPENILDGWKPIT